nr:hypothetical protein [Planococcus glaciei]
MLQKLMQQGYLAIEQEKENEILTEKISLQPLWDRLLDCVYKEQHAEKEKFPKSVGRRSFPAV